MTLINWQTPGARRSLRAARAGTTALIGLVAFTAFALAAQPATAPAGPAGRSDNAQAEHTNAGLRAVTAAHDASSSVAALDTGTAHDGRGSVMIAPPDTGLSSFGFTWSR